jgi:hypothetical protein
VKPGVQLGRPPVVQLDERGVVAPGGVQQLHVVATPAHTMKVAHRRIL